MDQDSLQLFSRQLFLWSETAISQGRYPFRRVETAPLLLTGKGHLSPPLVFWINRDSFMAGGVLLLPPREAEEAIEMGRACASALGLRHFVAWAPREIVFWEELGNEAKRCKTITLPVGGDPSPDDFRKMLVRILEELKVLCILGAVPPAQLSPHYLANLCRTAMETALPHMEENYRIVRGAGGLEVNASTKELAFSKGLMTLLRLLGLIFHDRLPSTVQPQGLERAMLFALDTLPVSVREAMQRTAGEIPLPAESAVRFHHLLRRLTQLQCSQDRQRAREVLEIVLACDGPRVGASPLPDRTPSAEGVTMLVNPGEVAAGESIMEIGSPPLLALLALLREIMSLPAARLQACDPFVLSLPGPAATIRGTLSGNSIPSEPERRKFATHLRTSWPTRRFSLHRRTPNWGWEFIHLLGLAREGAEIDVHIPEDWLAADYGERIGQLLSEEFALEFLSRSADGMLRLRLIRGADPDVITTVISVEGARQIPWQSLAAHRILLRLSLDLPDRLFRILEDYGLRIPEAQECPEELLSFLPGKECRPRSKTGAPRKELSSEELSEQIAAAVLIDGLPRFPEQYLYDHYRPLLQEYEFAGPLRICDEFFGRVKLCDQKGKIIEVDGIEPARALLLASYSNTSRASIPVERELTAAILGRYLGDLTTLRQKLVRQCHIHLCEQRAADALAEQIWNESQLPPWPMTDE